MKVFLFNSAIKVPKSTRLLKANFYPAKSTKEIFLFHLEAQITVSTPTIRRSYKDTQVIIDTTNRIKIKFTKEEDKNSVVYQVNFGNLINSDVMKNDH